MKWKYKILNLKLNKNYKNYFHFINKSVGENEKTKVKRSYQGARKTTKFMTWILKPYEVT